MPHHEAPLPHHEARGAAHGGRADAELTAILPEITGPSGQFRHRQHIHLAFLAVRRYGMPEAMTRICDWIQRIAAYERAPQKYHHTVSRAWVEIVAHHAMPIRTAPTSGFSPTGIPRCSTSACWPGTTGPQPWPPPRPGSAGSSRTSCRSPGRPVRTAVRC